MYYKGGEGSKRTKKKKEKREEKGKTENVKSEEKEEEGGGRGCKGDITETHAKRLLEDGERGRSSRVINAKYFHEPLEARKG